MKIKMLCKTDWVSLRQMIDPENDVNGYDYLHEDRCNGKIVAILPYRINDGKHEFLLRSEVTPCWSMEHPVVSCITGGVDDGDGIRETVVHEIAEEAGYEITKEDLIFLGKSFGTKSSDTRYFIYTIDLTAKEKTLDASGDGSELERKAHCFWSDTIENAQDPLVYVAYYRLNNIKEIV